jgi:hypothetical protein
MSDRTAPPLWRTSSYSDGGQCVETALDTPCVLVRDSMTPGLPVHTFVPRAWGAFITAIKPAR